VDDDPSVLRALARLLRVRSLDAKTYGSAMQFLAAMPGRLPECLIVDLQMPAMNGLELHHNLRFKGIEIPAIIISAHDDSAMRQRCEAAGIAAYLLKPVQETDLFSAIAKARGGAKAEAKRAPTG
jgi:FixJ family two-component response regulator